jgi:predicted peptidase
MPHRECPTDFGLNYLLYLPKDYVPMQKYPTILFLHGAGERGSNLLLINKHGLPKHIMAGDEFPFIIVAPQCPTDSWWRDELKALNKLLDHMLTTYPIDKTRFYLTGMSMGGQGTWTLAVEHSELFAAVVPICPLQLDNPQRVCVLKDIPVWVFHGAKDTAVPISHAEVMVEALKACGGNVQFTVYPEAEHDSWTETYNNPQLYKWFLEHQRV